MKNKTIRLIFHLLFYTLTASAQNGTYLSKTQGFYSNSSDNTVCTCKATIAININETSGTGTINIDNTSKGTNFKYDILAKILCDINEEKRIITRVYKTIMNVNNIQIGDIESIKIIESMDEASLSLWVSHRKNKYNNYYLNLLKLK